MDMSFLKRLFNKKEHEPLSGEPVDEQAYPEEEEDSENELESDNYFATEKHEHAVTDGDEEEEYEVVEREILPAKIICPDCGGITLEGLDYCDKCGGELK
jgi:SepF-like predicted cell division protein (DUF552 family)